MQQQVVRLTRQEVYEKMFWAIRGGGGNFGIVMGIELRIFPIHRVLSGTVNYPESQHRDVLKFYRDFLSSARDELTTGVVIGTSGPGQSELFLSVCYTGTSTRVHASSLR